MEATAGATLAEVADIGVQLWLDDFGTGPSALRYLTSYPFTTLKLDSSFVYHIVEEPQLARLVSGLILLAHHLELQVVAEAVWQEPQRALLRTFGCDMMQGWLVSRPLPADEFATQLATRRSAGLALEGQVGMHGCHSHLLLFPSRSHSSCSVTGDRLLSGAAVLRRLSRRSR